MLNQLLSTDEFQELEALAQSPDEAIRRRALVLLNYAAGKPTRLVAAEAGLSRGRARYWRRQYQLRGMAIFKAAPRRSSSTPLAQEAPDFIPAEVTPETALASQQPGEESLPFPRPLEKPGVQPEDTEAEAGRKILLFHFAEMLRHEPGTRLGADIEELHDMRVATRRMRAAFDVFGNAYKPKIKKSLFKDLRATGRALGRVRDLDVLLANTRLYQESLPESDRAGLMPLLEDWQDKRETARIALINHFDHPDYQDFRERFNIFAQTPGMGARIPEQGMFNLPQVRDIAPVLIYTRLADVRAYDVILRSASLDQMHALRIAFKKLRYAIEFFREVLGEEARDLINGLKNIQDHLGNLNDTRVACQLVASFMENWDSSQSRLPVDKRLNPTQIVAYLAALHTVRYRLMVSFPDVWNEFHSPAMRQTIARAMANL